MTPRLIRIVLISVILLQTAAAQAQSFGGLPTSPGTVTSSGVSSIERMPESMRLQIQLLSKGSDLKQALAGLKDRIEAARVQVSSMGALRESIHFGDPSIASTKTDEQRQMEMMLAQRLRNRKQKPKKASNPMTVSVEMTAEWPLKAKTVENLLLETYKVQEDVKKADLAGLAETSKLSPEEQELLEEAQSSFGGYGSGDEAKPGEPAFLFVSRISKEDQNRALSEAFQMAKAEAAGLAKAAGARLGSLSSLAKSVEADTDYPYNAMMYQILQRSKANQQNSDEAEALESNPGKVKYSIMVTVSFRLTATK